GVPPPRGYCPGCWSAAPPARCSPPTGAPGSSYLPRTSTPAQGGPGCPTGGPPSCSARPPAGRRSTSCGTLLTHATEEGANTSTLLAYSGHTSAASLARYARVSPEGPTRWQAGRDPARRS